MTNGREGWRGFPPVSETRSTSRAAASVAIVPRDVAILRELEKLTTGEFVFPGQARNKPLSNTSMEMVLRPMKLEGAQFTAFAPASEIGQAMSPTSRAKSETALAHAIGDKAEQAYRRSDALETRCKLMDAWSRVL